MNVHDEAELTARIAELRREIPPPKDQWPAIAARIDRRRGWVPRWFGGFAAAAAAVVVVLGLTAQLFSDRPQPADDRVLRIAVDPALQQGLDALLDGRVDLSSMTVALLRTNLALVDNALHEISAALELDPSNPLLHQQLHDTYRGQAELLDNLRRAPHGT
ncbi:MAG: hypothetical protein WD081_05150 [Gammaproteobacteria bacterium]